jgi:hypothetical protein
MRTEVAKTEIEYGTQANKNGEGVYLALVHVLS